MGQKVFMYRVQAWQGLKLVRFHAKIGHTLKKIIIASTILENKVFWRNRAISKKFIIKVVVLIQYFLMKIKFRKIDRIRYSVFKFNAIKVFENIS